jgi:hypothetical protein
MKILIPLILFISILNYNSKEISIRKTNSIKGIWTDGSSENATFQINEKTIYYVDELKEYKYSFKNNTLKIFFQDYTFIGVVSFKKDTLIINSNGISRKYWKFKG